MAGFTLREADDIRRAMGKKKKEVLEPYEVKFLDGAAAVGKINKSLAKEIWQEMVNFADYAFNKSHSICYSYLSYVCAWLKANYPVEFFCSLMTIRSLNNTKWEKAPEFIFEARQRGLKIHGPNINRSHAEFVPEQDDIYWGFQAIKGIGKSTGEAIVRARGATKFKDIWDFLDRVDRSKINSGNFKALAAAGAFDCLGYDRDELVAQAETLYEHLRLEEKYQERLAAKAEAEQQNARRAVRKEELDSQAAQAKARKKAKLELTSEDQAILDRPDRMARLRELARQCKLTGSTLQSVMTVEELLEYEEQQWLRNQAVPKIPDVPPRWSPTRTKQLAISVPALQNQRKYCGAYVGIHPAQVMFPNSVSFKDAEHKDFGTYAGEINGVKEITTKRGQKMAFATLEDSSSRAEVIIFPTTWSKLQKEGLANRLEGSLCLVRGEIEIEGDPLENPVIKIKANSFKLS
jgi:DNA polymerase III alpha subunit